MLYTVSGIAMWPRWWNACNMKDELSQANLLILFSILIIFGFLCTIKKSRNVAASLPPGPRGLPFVGYLPFLGTDLHRAFTGLSRVYGPIYKLWLGNKLCVVLSSPSLVKEVVKDQDSIFANRSPSIAAIAVTFGGNDIAFSSYGPEWRKLRKIFVHQMLGSSSLDACYDLRSQEVKKSISDVHNKIGVPINIGQLAFSTAINAITSMLCGGILQGEMETNFGAEFQGVVTELMVLLGKPNVSDFFPMLARFDMQGIERKTKKIALWCDRILSSAIDKRLNANANAVTKKGAGKIEQRKDFLKFLLDLKENDDDAKSITLSQLKALLMDIMIGGTDTTSTAVEWVMAEMLQHPNVMKRVQEELTEVVGLDNRVEESHLPQLHYLVAVVKETLRLHPPLPLLVPHCPSQSSVVGGYTIPKGASIFLNVWAIHRDPEIWNTPLEFQPERFLNDSKKLDFSGNNFVYLTFGSGRRVCAGLPLAERMLMYILASFLHSFEWELPNGTKLEFAERFGIVLKKMRPLVATPSPRLSNSKLYTL
ncbi:hypothetical protein F0562_012776 [Nyssa sinensis]|uniref:Uncharacterized protein n=1 Tax=Nyssa sinensis TaxID=561372 RepID=A0A5J4ZU85_9ASTE|nr:hypothetical protein F0562_012776 [Nyssa sinensis]